MRKPWSFVPSAAVNQKDFHLRQVELGEESIVKMGNRIRTGCFVVPLRSRPAFRCFLVADNGITCRDCANDSVKFGELNGLTRTINKLFHRNQALKVGKDMYVTESSSLL